MCWNYRRYGKSEDAFLGSLNPYICKMDSERVLDFILNKLKLKGKIGVYGRSLGGIAACHLAHKYPDIIYTLICDRTFGDLEEAAHKKILGNSTKMLYNIVSCSWKILNFSNFARAKCFKIVTADPFDDVVDNFASLPMMVARELALNKYEGQEWHLFFKNLSFIFDMEEELHEKMEFADEEQMKYKFLRHMETAFEGKVGSESVQTEIEMFKSHSKHMI